MDEGRRACSSRSNWILDSHERTSPFDPMAIAVVMLSLSSLSLGFAFQLSVRRRCVTQLTRRSMIMNMGASTPDVDSLLSGKLQVSLDDALTVHGHDHVAFLDGSWWLASRETTARQDYETFRIQGAYLLDVDDVARPSPFPHMMPPSHLHAAAMDRMQITPQHHLIIYGQHNCPYIHRAWYQCATFHDRSKVHWMGAATLEQWQKRGGPVDTTPIQSWRVKDLDLTSTPHYSVVQESTQMKDLAMMRAIVDEGGGSAIVVDARAGERFRAQVEEPRPGLRKGHMPGAKNVFFMDLLDTEDLGKIKPASELRRIFQQSGVDLSSPQQIVAYCGSGATACTVAAAMMVCRRPFESIYIYDASWMEWASLQDTPIVTTD